jgi:ABC-2 type transport system ATP-binding protein
MNAFETRSFVKRFGGTRALDGVDVQVRRRQVVGLVGRNGSGKSTLLRSVTGVYLPDAGECITLGTRTDRLGRAELSRIGFADQRGVLIRWMTGEQLLRYVSSFYATWDRELEGRLVRELELNVAKRVHAMSPGNVQKLSLIAATCHRPELLLLDEPLSDLDPLARRRVLEVLLERFSSDDITIVISSHMLRDIEPVVNHIICLDGGRVVAHDDLDALYERYAEWIVTSATGRLPQQFAEPWVLTARGDAHRARLLVRDAAADREAFAAVHEAVVETRPVNLETIFPLLVGTHRDEAREEAVVS